MAWREQASFGVVRVRSLSISGTSSAAQSMSVGTKANVIGSGIPIPSTDDWGAVRIFADDNGASIADSVRALQSRILLTYDQAGGSIRALQGQIKLLDGIDVTTGIYTAAQGYLELAATHSAKTGATLSCFDASLEIGTALTVDSGGEACGIHVETTGSGTITNNGTCAGILIDKASGAASWPVGLAIVSSTATTGISIGTTTTGILIGAATTALNITGATTNAIAISGASSNSAIWISGAGTEGYNEASILLAADQAGTALAYGAGTAGFQGIYINATAAVTGGENWHGIYTKFTTSAAMADGFIINNYSRVNLSHVAYENYAIWGRMNVNVAQTGNTGNQYLGVFGSVSFAAGAHALTATGGGYGVLGTAGIASGGTLDQPMIGGYFECNAVDNIAGLTTASRHRMLGYCDYGVDVLCQTSNGTSGIRVQTTDSAVLAAALTLASPTGGITNLLDLPASGTAPVSSGGTVGTHGTATLKIAIDINGTTYYLLASTVPTFT